MNKEYENIETEDSGIDDLMRRSLNDHRIEPSLSVWKGITRKLLWNEILHLNFANVTPRLWIYATISVAVISAAFYLILDNRFKDDIPAGEQTVAPVTVLETGLNAGAGTAASTGPNIAVHGQRNAAATLPSDAESGIHYPAVSVAGERPVNVGKAPDELLPKDQGQAESPDASSATGSLVPVPALTAIPGPPMATTITFNRNAGSARFTPMIPREADLFSFDMGPDTLIPVLTSKGTILVRKSHPSRRLFYSASLGIQPEAAFNAGIKTTADFSYWINGGITAHLSRFSLTTGLGVGSIYDESAYRIEYVSNDSIGYFANVVSYSVGAGNEIFYQTVIENIYDSVMHVAEDRARNRSTYLQIPFLIGYRLFQTDHLSLTFRAGPAVSFLVAHKDAEPFIGFSHSRIIRIQNETPVRKDITWQFWSDLNLEIRMNLGFSIYVSPAFRYYLSPVTETENKASVSPPWSMGLGVGIQYNFGRKKD